MEKSPHSAQSGIKSVSLFLSFFALLVFIAGYHHSPGRKLWPSAHFRHAGVHSSLITPFRWYKLGLSRTVSMMDDRGRYETHWSISWISSWVSRQLCPSALTLSRRWRWRILPRFSAAAPEIFVWVPEETSHNGVKVLSVLAVPGI